MSDQAVEILITNAIHTAFIKYPEGDGGPNLDYDWIAPDQTKHIAKAILQDLAANGYQIVKKARLRVPDWQRKFDNPIETPEGTQLNALREAVAHLAKTVPKSEHDVPAVTTAAEMLTYATERGIAWMFMARIATLQAIHRNKVREFNPDRRGHRWGKRKLKRDQ